MTGRRADPAGIHPRVLTRSLSSERQHGVKTFLQSPQVRGLARRFVARALQPVKTTFPRLLLEHAAARPGAPALREKEFGIWQTHSWSALLRLVEAIACGFAQAGLTRGQHVVVIGENRPRLYASMLAAQSLGAIPVPLYQDAPAGELVFPIANADVPFAVVERDGARRFRAVDDVAAGQPLRVREDVLADPRRRQVG